VPAPRTSLSLAEQPGAWPLPGGDASGRRSTTAEVALTGTISWTAAVDAAIVAPLVVGGEAAYVAVADGTLRALELSDGSERWRIQVPGWLDAAPAVAADRLVVGQRDGHVRAIDLRSGAELWRYQFGRAVSASPTLFDGTVYVAASGGVAALDAQDGRLLWQLSLDDAIVVASPAVEGDLVAIGTADRLLLLDRTTAAVRFEWPIAAARGRVVALALEGAHVVASTERALLAVDREQRSPWWAGLRRAWQWLHLIAAAPAPTWDPFTWSAPHGRASPAAVADGIAIAAGHSGWLRAYEAASGVLTWERRGVSTTAAPVIADAVALIAAGRMLVQLDLADGSERGRLTLDSDVEGVITEVVPLQHGLLLRLDDHRLLMAGR
jgi:outer membrane protein assembly factor BamB